MSPSLRHRHIASPRRHLVLRHAQRRVVEYNRLSLQSNDDESSADEKQIVSAYRVPLPADRYIVSVTQTIIAPSEDQISPTSSKRFNVVAPRLSLPADAVHSTYPPQGHHDTLEILPHVAFNDSHFPWERAIEQPADTEDGRNRVPWLALLTFTQDELRIPGVALEQAQNASSPTVTQALRLDVSTVTSLEGIETPLTNLNDVTGVASFIFVTPKLFSAYVTKFGADGKPDPSQDQADISRYKYLCHSRRLDTTGMAESAEQDVALKSIIVSHRLAPLDSIQPVSIIAHLVSLEGIDSMPFPIGSSKNSVALVSLYSWVYTALPPSSVDTHDLFANIGRSIDLLRAPASVLAAIPSSKPFLPFFTGIWLQQRLQDGYALTRYRTKTGEVTVAMTRGALTPSKAPHPLSPDWTSVSRSGESLQIVDPDVGFIDLSYSAAWNLGKSMALADQAFSASLCRIRSTIFAESMNKTKKDHLQAHSALPSRLQVVESLPQLANRVHHLTQHPPLQLPIPDPLGNNSQKWFHAHPKRVDLSFDAPSVRFHFDKHASAATRRLASNLEDPSIPYNEHNTPYSADWALVLRWILDRMYLIDVPAHYLVTEPSHLPSESLRFFHIDPNWIDAYVDGALSICNHIGTDDIRSKIKAELHRYLVTVDPTIGYKPQIPTYGFLLRSKVVTLFPDLQVNITPLPADGRASILRLERIAPGLLLCLLDRVPPDDFCSLTLTQPPHQLSFAAAASVTANSFTTDYKRVYTKHVDDPNRANPLGTSTWTRGDTSRTPVFLWTDEDDDSDSDGDATPLRMLLFPAWANDVFDTIRDGMKDPDKDGSDHSDWFEDSTASAALNAIQLANPAYRLYVSLPNKQQGSNSADSTTVPLIPKASIALRVAKGPTGNKKYLASPLPSHHVAPNPPRNSSKRPRQLISSSQKNPPAVPRVERRGFYRHAAKHMRPPNFPTLPCYSPTARETAAAIPAGQTSGDNTQGLPKISFSMSAAGRAVGKPIPSKTDTPLDLIFIIRVTPDDSTSYQLKEVRITVFLGPNDSSIPRLTDGYDGPGATMLSNLRLYSLVQHDPDQETRALHLRLLPRSRKRQIPVSKLTEMSFCLSMLEVNAFNEDTTVQLRYQITYDSNFEEDWFPVELNADTTL